MASLVGSSQSNSSSQTTNNNSNSATNSNTPSVAKTSSITTIAIDTLENATINNALLTKVVENLNAVIHRSNNNQKVTKLLVTVEKMTSPNTVIESKLPEQLVLQNLLLKLNAETDEESIAQALAGTLPNIKESVDLTKKQKAIFCSGLRCLSKEWINQHAKNFSSQMLKFLVKNSFEGLSGNFIFHLLNALTSEPINKDQLRDAVMSFPTFKDPLPCSEMTYEKRFKKWHQGNFEQTYIYFNAISETLLQGDILAKVISHLNGMGIKHFIKSIFGPIAIQAKFTDRDEFQNSRLMKAMSVMNQFNAEARLYTFKTFCHAIPASVLAEIFCKAKEVLEIILNNNKSKKDDSKDAFFTEFLEHVFSHEELPQLLPVLVQYVFKNESIDRKKKLFEKMRQADKQQNSNSIMMSCLDYFNGDINFFSNSELLNLGSEILKKIELPCHLDSMRAIVIRVSPFIELPLIFDSIRAIANRINPDIDTIDKNIVRLAFIISTLEHKNFKEDFSFTSDTAAFIQKLFDHVDLCVVMYEIFDREKVTCSILSQLLISDDKKMEKLYDKVKNEHPEYWQKASEMGEDLTFSAIAKLSSKLSIPIFAAIVNGQRHNESFIGDFFKDYFLKETPEKQKELCSSLDTEVFKVDASHIPFGDKCKLSLEVPKCSYLIVEHIYDTDDVEKLCKEISTVNKDVVSKMLEMIVSLAKCGGYIENNSVHNLRKAYEYATQNVNSEVLSKDILKLIKEKLQIE